MQTHFESEHRVPWPDEWPRTPARKYYVAIGGILLLTVATPVALATVAYAAGDRGTGTGILLFAGLCALLMWIGYETRFRLRKSGAAPLRLDTTGSRGPALRVPYSLRIYIGYGLAMTLVAAAMLAGAANDLLNRPPGDRGGAFVWGLFALIFLSFPALMATGRFARGYILISPEGIYQRGWTFWSRLPWSAIETITPVQHDSPDIVITARDDAPWDRKQITRLWRQDRLPEFRTHDGTGIKPAMIIEGKFLEADPAVVLAILRYYARYPQARGELVTDAALRRARMGTFV